MADKAISELVSAEQITATDMFVLEQNGTAKKLTGQVLLNWLTAAADGHGGIQSWLPLKTEGLVKTFRVTLADQTYIDIDVVDGRGVEDVRKIKTEGLVDTYQIVYNDGPPGTFQVVNGAKGDKGDNAGIWVRYASQKPTAESHSFGELPDAWVGISSGHLPSAPTDWQAYTWYQWKGEKGDTGEPATIVSAEITYQASDSGTIIPSGSWGTSVPPVTPGRYLWTRQVLQFNTGAPITSYSVSRFGIDGTGAVSTVAGVAPDETGNVSLDAASLRALSLSGGTMEGDINMNGQKLRGLNAPTADDEPATKGYADNLKPDLTGYATETYVDNAVKEAAPYNYADNSDFTQFIAQAGIGGKHGNRAYAGDRWILDSGTVTGDAREDGNGYTNITLNGTIRQKVANAPTVGTVAIEMVSGTAQISYANGEITITSNGGVIKNVRLFKGAYTTDNVPNYQPKGYAAELLECMRCFRKIKGSYLTAYSYSASSAKNQIRITMHLGVAMRILPTVTMVSAPWKFRYNGTSLELKNVQFVGIGDDNTLDRVVVYLTNDASIALGYTGYITSIEFDLSADFPED